MKRTALALGLVFLGCGGAPAPEPAAPGPPASTPGPAPAADTSSAADAGATPMATADVPDASAAAAPAAPSADAVVPAADDSSSGDAAGVAYMESVHILYKQQQDALTKACWLHSKSTEHAYAGKAIIRVGPAGKIVSTKTSGTDDAASACIDKQVKKWKFPLPNGTATVTLPVRLHRD